MKRVVVTGMGVVSPVGNCVEDFWNSIQNGKCGIDFIKSFDASDFKVKIAAEVKGFDPLLYIPKNDVRKTDLYAQYALYAAGEAMQDSDISGKIAPERLGVYVGSGTGGLHTMAEECEKLRAGGPRKVSPFFVPMMISNIAAGSIAIRYGARGPCLPVVTACATSTHSIGEAFRAIRYGYADAIIAGGAEAAVTPLAVAGFTNCMALCARNDPANSSIPFDRRRDGFVMGEGAGILVLEEYGHAVKRNAKIYAEITGYANTCDAYHITAPAPDGAGALAAIKGAMKEAKGSKAEIIYINPHGTSTQLNDRTETLAIRKALGKRADSVMVGATKSMTGHMLGAAGAAEAIISVLALTKGIVPPTIGYREPDPECDLDYVPNKKRSTRVDLALSISLGFGGHNACLAFSKP